MKISELRTIASDIGEKKIVGMIKKEVTKARKDDGMVAICDMVCLLYTSDAADE